MTTHLKRIFIVGLTALLVVPTITSLAGCGADNAPAAEDKTKEQTRVNAATEQRALFDKAKGNYDSLSAADKARANELMGGTEASAREGFGKMGGGGATVAPAGSPPPTGGQKG